MKTIYSLLLLMLISTLAYSQAPEAFNYQAVIRNGAGDILANKQVAVQISILQDGVTDVYVERFNPTTNDYGMINLQLGKGSPQSGTFNTIDWGLYAFHIKIEVDPNNGTAFTTLGTSQLLSVPYALYAKSGGGDDADADPANELQSISKSGNTVTLSDGGGSFTDDVDDADADPTNELQTLTIGGQNLSISDGNMVTLPPPADNSINSAMIIDGEVKAPDIATDAVGSDEIAANAVGSSEIAADAVGSSEIATNAVGPDEIAANAVGSSEIATDAVGPAEIAANAVGSSEIAPSAVGASEVANGSLTRLDLLDEPAVRWEQPTTWYTITGTWNDLARITVTAPANGFMYVSASGSLSLIKNSSAAAGSWGLDLHTSPDEGPGWVPMAGSKSAARGWFPASWVFTTEMGIPFHIQEVFPVAAGVTYSFYLNGRVTGFSTASAFHPSIVAIFIPSGL